MTLRLAPLACAILLLTACGGKPAADGSAARPAGPEEKVLNVYNWSDYVAADTIENFENASRGTPESVYSVYESPRSSTTL